MMVRKSAVRAFALMLLLSFSVILQTGLAQEDEDVRVFIAGPDALGVSEKAVYTVTVVGGPGEEEGGKWRVAAHLTGANVTGSSPTLGEKFNETQDSNIFQVNVTAPPIPQKMVLNIEGASLLGNQSVLVSDDVKISIVRPINFRATIKNPSNSTLENVLVSFKVDGELVGSAEPIKQIGPLGEGTASYSWITKEISPGRHELKIEIDLNGDGVIDEERGESFFIEGFYGPQGDPNIFVVILIVLLVIIIILLLPSTLRRKKKRK